MGFLDALFNPNKNTNNGYKKSQADFETTRSITDPFYQQSVDNGGQANGMLADFLGLNGADAQRKANANYMEGPAYDFTLNEGTRAINNAGNASGMSKSGTTLKALQEYGQNLHGQEMGNYLGRLSAVGAGGYNGASGLTGNSQHFGNLAIGKGQAQDAGNAAIFGNVMSLGTTLASGMAGMPSMGGGGGIGKALGGMSSGGGLSSLFGGQTKKMPTYFGQNGRINPYGGY